MHLFWGDGIKTIVKDVITIAPARNPTAEENQQIRNLIKEAFVVRYGRENAERSLPAIDAPENLTRPVRMTDLSGAFEQASEWMEQNAALVQNDESFSTQFPSIPVDVAEALAEHPALAESDEVMRQKDLTLSSKAHENLDSPNKALGPAAWYAGESVARAAGVVGGTIAGDLPKDAFGAAGAGAGVPVSGVMVGGAVPLALIPTPDGARRALEYYAPGDALAKAREALNDWSSGTANRGLELMQEAQETDLEAIAALQNLFENFIPVGKSLSESLCFGQNLKQTKHD